MADVCVRRRRGAESAGKLAAGQTGAIRAFGELARREHFESATRRTVASPLAAARTNQPALSVSRR